MLQNVKYGHFVDNVNRLGTMVKLIDSLNSVWNMLYFVISQVWSISSLCSGNHGQVDR
jgi:hypothetical protein